MSPASEAPRCRTSTPVALAPKSGSFDIAGNREYQRANLRTDQKFPGVGAFDGGAEDVHIGSTPLGVERACIFWSQKAQSSAPLSEYAEVHTVGAYVLGADMWDLPFL